MSAQEVLANVHFAPSYVDVAKNAYIDEQYGFVVSDVAGGIEAPVLVGFAAGRETVRDYGYYGTNGVRIVNSITELEDMPENERNIDIVGKGVGLRLHTDGPQAIGSVKGRNKEQTTAQVYVIDFNRDSLQDMRGEGDSTFVGMTHRIIEHGKRMFRAQRLGLAEEVALIHAEFDPSAQGIIYNQAPRARARQWMHRIPQQKGIKSEFMVMRDPQQSIYEVGRYVLSKS